MDVGLFWCAPIAGLCALLPTSFWDSLLLPRLRTPQRLSLRLILSLRYLADGNDDISNNNNANSTNANINGRQQSSDTPTSIQQQLLQQQQKSFDQTRNSAKRRPMHFYQMLLKIVREFFLIPETHITVDTNKQVNAFENSYTISNISNLIHKSNSNNNSSSRRNVINYKTKVVEAKLTVECGGKQSQGKDAILAIISASPVLFPLAYLIRLLSRVPFLSIPVFLREATRSFFSLLCHELNARYQYYCTSLLSRRKLQRSTGSTPTPIGRLLIRLLLPRRLAESRFLTSQLPTLLKNIFLFLCILFVLFTNLEKINDYDDSPLDLRAITNKMPYHEYVVPFGALLKLDQNWSKFVQ